MATLCVDSSLLLRGKSSGKVLPAASRTVHLLVGAGNRAVAVGAVVAAEVEAEAAATAAVVATVAVAAMAVVGTAVVGTAEEMETAAGAEATTVAGTEGAGKFALKPRPFRADQDR